MEQVDQIRGVLRRPVVGLDPVERRGRAPVADQRLRPVPATVGEPLAEHGLPRDLVGPDRSRHVVDEPVAHMQAARGGVVGHRVGQGMGGAGDGAAGRDDGARRYLVQHRLFLLQCAQRISVRQVQD